MPKIDDLISFWSMKPSPTAPEGVAWEAGCRQGYEWGVSEVAEALDGAHWLSGSASERVRALLAERDAAIEGTHPVQRARGLVLVPAGNEEKSCE